jgi:hypothetical protein
MRDCRTCSSIHLEYQHFCNDCDPDYSNWESMYPEEEEKDEDEYIFAQNISWRDLS